MWVPETPLRDDGDLIIKALALGEHASADSYDLGESLCAILSWQSITSRLLGIPKLIAEAAGKGLKKRIQIPLRAFSKRVAELATDLEHRSIHSVHLVYALVWICPEGCAEFFRTCDRQSRDSAPSPSADDLAFVSRLRAKGELEAEAIYRFTLRRRVFSPPYVLRTLALYLTSTWYPFSRVGFERHRLLGAEAMKFEDVDGFSATLGYDRHPPFLNEEPNSREENEPPDAGDGRRNEDL